MRTKTFINTGLITLALLLGTTAVDAQERASRRSSAEQLYNSLEYARAAKAYEDLVDVKKPRTIDMERLANSYYYINQYELAENWYARVVEQKDASKDVRLNYADVLKQQGKYAEAKEQYQRYIASHGDQDILSRAILGADSAISWMKNPTKHQLYNEKNINTALAEFGLIPTSGGVLYAGEPNSILDTKSGMTGQAYLRVYSAEQQKDGSLNYPNILSGAFNHSQYHVGPVSTNAAEDVLYVTRTYTGKDAERFKAVGSKWKKQNLELKIFKKSGDQWLEEDFPYNNVQQYSLGHAVLSTDEKTLYYASDMPGGLGGVDIWFSELQVDGSWGSPKNAGSDINTQGDEMFPSVFGNTLYFSSNGLVGMGGLDIFKAKVNNGQFSTPINLGYPINSSSDDFAFVEAFADLQGSRGYLSSNRSGGVGSDDIYSYTYVTPKITIILEGLTKDKSTGAILTGTTVSLREEGGRIVSKDITNGDGLVRFEVAANTGFRMLGEKSGYLSDSLAIAGIQATRDTVVRYTLLLQPVFTKGTKFVLENIYYDFDKHNIRPDAAKILDKLVATLRDNPTLRIELSSHTDSRGADSYNMKLSQRRAQSAVDYIVSRGIARDRLVAKGYGETRLVNRCSNGVQCSSAEHQANRRTEVEVLEF